MLSSGLLLIRSSARIDLEAIILGNTAKRIFVGDRPQTPQDVSTDNKASLLAKFLKTVLHFQFAVFPMIACY